MFTAASLLTYGAEINARDNKGRTPLMYAVMNKRNVVIDLLLNKGGDVNVQDNNGITVLEMAQQSGNDKVLKLRAPNQYRER